MRIKLKELAISTLLILKTIEDNMADVYLWSGIRQMVEDKQPLKVNGSTLEELLINLIKNYPNLKTIIEEGVSCSVDDKLVMSSTSEKIGENSEVYLFQKLSGG